MKGSAVRARNTSLSPMVATISRTRARLKRRRNTSSDSAPTAGRSRSKDQREPVLEMEVGGQLDQEDGSDDADLALGEVDNPVGPVDEDEADGE